jgi:hypothetical protein
MGPILPEGQSEAAIEGKTSRNSVHLRYLTNNNSLDSEAYFLEVSDRNYYYYYDS